MIRNRIDGFIALHSLVLGMILCASFMGTVLFIQATDIISLNPAANLQLYSFGVLVAAWAIYRHMHAAARRYGRFTLRDNLWLSLQQIVRVLLVLFAINFVTKDTGVSRLFFLAFIALTTALFLLVNLFLPRILAALFLRDSTLRTAIVASAPDAVRLQKWLERNAEIGIRLTGYISPKPSGDLKSLRWLGEPGEITEIIKSGMVDQILIDQTAFDRVRSRQIIDQCEQLGCRARSFVDIGSLLPSPNAAFEHDGRYGFATITPEPLDNPLNQIAKRMLDIAIAVPVVILVLPLVLFVAVFFQAIQSPGPLLYYQDRSGINRRRFRIFKIRTMHLINAEPVGQQASRNDRRVYAFGRFLRRTSLDELPQFLNVLRGEMSVSGPRPHLLEHDEAFARVISAYRKRHFVKPGITGLAQSKGYRGEIGRSSSIERRVRYDMHYIANWSMMMDLRIIADTVRQIMFPPSSAY